LSLRSFGWRIVAPVQEPMQNERDLVGMRCTPGDDAFELDAVVGDGADFHQFVIDDLRVSHRRPAWHMLTPGEPARYAGGLTPTSILTSVLNTAGILKQPPTWK
jgi:hypothetical protein